VDFVFECRWVVFELEGFRLKSFWKDTSTHTHIGHVEANSANMVDIADTDSRYR